MVLAAVDDLLFRSRIRAVAKQVGADVQFARTAADVLDAVRARCSPGATDPAGIDLAIVDLHAAAIDPLGSLAALRAEGIPSIGFFAHVQTDLAQAALEAGATHVMPRSAFAMRLPEILQGSRSKAKG